MAMRDLFGYASMLSLLLASVAVGCSGEDEDPEQTSLPVFGQGGTGGAAPVGANGGTGGTAPVGAGGTAPVAANGGTAGAPVAANGGTGGAPAANGGTGGTAGAPGAGGTGVNAGMGGTGAGGTASVPPGAGGAAMGMGGAGMEPPPTGESVSFEDDVWPIFMARCGGCHTTGRQGGQSVGSPTLSIALADAQRLGQTLVNRLDGGGMPPGCNTVGTGPCITVAQLETVEDWVAGGELP